MDIQQQDGDKGSYQFPTHGGFYFTEDQGSNINLGRREDSSVKQQLHN